MTDRTAPHQAPGRGRPLEPPGRAVAVMPAGAADVVYVDDAASTAIVTAALRAWGLRVRAERDNQHSGTRGLESESAWMTVRPDGEPVSRLLNTLSAAWLPTFDPATRQLEETATVLSWFVCAA